jgi:hypothetical protein
MRPGLARCGAVAVVLAAAVAWLGAASPDSVAQTLPTTPPASSSGEPYVGYVGVSTYVAEASPYVRAGAAVLPPPAGNAAAVSVGGPAEAPVLGGAAEEGPVVTGWDFVGLSAMTLGAVGAIGLLIGRRRSL